MKGFEEIASVSKPRAFSQRGAFVDVYGMAPLRPVLRGR
jgi:hypothetical protein